MYNIWLVRTQLKRVVNSLAHFLGTNLWENASKLSKSAADHPDWQDFFVIHTEIDDDGNLIRIEIKEEEF